MKVLQANPCEACTIGQDCCTHLSGLRLTQIEFDRCFQHHTDDILVEREEPLFVVSQKDGSACPNWQDGGCAVYDERPRECALFPHTLYVKQQDGSFTVRVHADTNCPLKAQLKSSQHEAEQLAKEFAEEAFGSTATIRVQSETGSQLLYRRLRHLISRILGTVLK